jgi:hypothetical protein
LPKDQFSLVHFDRADEHVYAPHNGPLVQSVGEGPIERLLLFHRAAFVQLALRPNTVSIDARPDGRRHLEIPVPLSTIVLMYQRLLGAIRQMRQIKGRGFLDGLARQIHRNPPSQPAHVSNPSWR